MQHSDFFYDQTKAKEVGLIASADYVVTGSFNLGINNSIMTIRLKILDIERGYRLGSGKVEVRTERIQNLLNEVKKKSKVEIIYESTDLIYLDDKNRLLWERNQDDYIGFSIYDDAKEYCENLVIDGIDNWRLPTEIEIINMPYKQMYNLDLSAIWYKGEKQATLLSGPTKAGYMEFIDPGQCWPSQSFQCGYGEVRCVSVYKK